MTEPTESDLSPKSGMDLDPWIDRVMNCFHIRSRVLQQQQGIPRAIGGQVEFSLDRAWLTKVLIDLCEHRVATDKALEKTTKGGIILPGR